MYYFHLDSIESYAPRLYVIPLITRIVVMSPTCIRPHIRGDAITPRPKFVGWVIKRREQWQCEYRVWFLWRPRGDMGKEKNNGNIPYVRNHDPVRTQSWSCTYTIYPVRTQSLSRRPTYAVMIPYVRNLSRTYAIIILYVRNHDPVRTQSWSRTYAIIKIQSTRKQGRSLGGGEVRTPLPPPPPEHRIVATFCTVFVS